MKIYKDDGDYFTALGVGRQQVFVFTMHGDCWLGRPTHHGEVDRCHVEAHYLSFQKTKDNIYLEMAGNLPYLHILWRRPARGQRQTIF